MTVKGRTHVGLQNLKKRKKTGKMSEVMKKLCEIMRLVDPKINFIQKNACSLSSNTNILPEPSKFSFPEP